MKLLLDSCVFLWMINQYQKIPLSTRKIITDSSNELYLSSISVIEIVIKANNSRLDIEKPYAEFITNQRIKHEIASLSLNEKDLVFLEKLPNINADPFDRILICQAIANEMTIVTSDKYIASYPVKILW
jgi:PIN domain nuclease of toxin-antitoxin system